MKTKGEKERKLCKKREQQKTCNELAHNMDAHGNRTKSSRKKIHQLQKMEQWTIILERSWFVCAVSSLNTQSNVAGDAHERSGGSKREANFKNEMC